MGVLLYIIMALHVFVLISTIIHFCFHQLTSALLPPMSWEPQEYSQTATAATARPSYPATTTRPSYSTTTTRPSYPATTTRPSYSTTTTRPPYPTTTWPSYSTTTIRPSYPTNTWPSYSTTTSKPQTTTTEAPEGVCPDGWFNAHRLGCYYFDYADEEVSWVEAMDVCDRMGGYLAEIQTQEQADLIASIAMVEESLTGVGSWWIGLTDMSHEGRWMWSHSSTDSTYTDWLPGHPSTEPHNTDDCVSISMFDNLLWRNAPCYKNITAAPICQRDLDLDTTTTAKPTTITTAKPSTTTPYPTQIELRDGNGYSSGNVFVVNRDGYLGPVCDDDWDSRDARVACRQLGFTDGTKTTSSYFGSVPSHFAMDDVNCSGNEEALQECGYNKSDNCGSDEGAGVKCFDSTAKPTAKPTTIPTSPPYPTHIERRDGNGHSSGNMLD